MSNSLAEAIVSAVLSVFVALIRACIAVPTQLYMQHKQQQRL